MGDLSELLGQGRLADDVAGRLLAEGARIWLQGPPGSGKSTVAGMVAERLRRDGRVVRLQGDASQVGTRFLAAHRALAGTRLSKSMRDALPGAILAPIRLVPYAGSSLAEWARVAMFTSTRLRPDFLGADQIDVLDGLQKLSGVERAFLVVDDVQWLDAETLQLLATLTRTEVRKAFPFADGLSILFVENVDAASTANADALSALRSSDVVRCAPVARRDFEGVLTSFGLDRALDGRMVDDLYAISKGHLEIAKQIVKLDKGADLATLLANGDATSLMAELLDKRLGASRGATALLRLLSVAACAGSTFSEAELRCAYVDPDAFPTALQAARREDLLVKEDGDALRFAHDVVRVAAQRLGSAQAADLHAKLAGCVKRLRPGDYAGRLRHLRLARQDDEAAQVAFALAMRGVRGAGSPSRGDPIEVGALRPALDDLREGYRLMDAGHHRRSLDLATRHCDGSATLVQGEVVILMALNRIKQRTSDAYGEAVDLLGMWRTRKGETELWERVMSVLAAALANAGDVDQASRIHVLLCTDVELRARTDEAARTRLETLNRRADMFFPSEVAERHVRKAVAWFGPRQPDGMPRDGFEYTASEVNLSGCLYTVGRFREAAQSAGAAMRYVEVLGAMHQRTVEPYKAINNYAISAFRAGAEDARDLGVALDVVLEGSTGARLRDRTLLVANRAVLALMCGEVGRGGELLRSAWAEVVSLELDDYYRLYCGSNLAIATALAGERREASDILQAAQGCVEAMPKRVRHAHRRRHAMMSAAVLDASVDTAAAFDAYPARARAPDGDQDPWWSIGRGFLLSDIQVWSEA